MGFSKMSAQRGFSLIETLVVIGVLAVVGYIMTGLLTNTLKGGNKTELIGTIKQNGERALGVMSDTIRSSDNVVCVGQYTGANDTVVISKGGIYTLFRFVPQVSNTTNGYILEDTPAAPADPSQVANLCTQASSAQAVKLTDNNPTTGVSIQNGPCGSPPALTSFQLNPGVKSVVAINFCLVPAVGAGLGAQNQVGGLINFRTSVSLR
jgi:prepilin-type N-terminal cleavage/methylation domain-containing protein